MKVTQYCCDICEEILTDHNRLYLAVDRKMDAAGSMDTWHEEIDLCSRCKNQVILQFFKSRPYEDAQAFVKCLTDIQQVRKPYQSN